jgi:hypothetical protein
MQYVGISHEVIYMQYVGLYCARMIILRITVLMDFHTSLFTCSMLDFYDAIDRQYFE